MAAGLSGPGGILIAFAPAALLRGAGPANPLADFGPLTGLAIALDVINTLVVVYYVWRIWTRPVARRA